jgi:hypothetical protein
MNDLPMIVRRPSGFIEPCLPSKVTRPASGPLVAPIDTSPEFAIWYCHRHRSASAPK